MNVMSRRNFTPMERFHEIVAGYSLNDRILTYYFQHLFILLF